jgi:hypothetical protein
MYTPLYEEAYIMQQSGNSGQGRFSDSLLLLSCSAKSQSVDRSFVQVGDVQARHCVALANVPRAYTLLLELTKESFESGARSFASGHGEFRTAG